MLIDELIENEEKLFFSHKKLKKAPLTPQQKSLWFEQQVSPKSAAYNIPIVLSFEKCLDNLKLSEAVDALVKKHRILRTNFREEEGVPVAVVNKPFHYNLETINVNDITERRDTIQQIAQSPFELDSTPLFRIVNILLDGKSTLVIVFHHIISDGTSIDSFSFELSKEYTMLTDTDLENDNSTDYLDYAEWVTGEALQENKLKTSKWAENIKNYPQFLNLPVDFSRGDIINANEGNRIEFTIKNSIQKDIRFLADKKNVSEFSIYLAAYYILLGKMSHQEQLLVGVPFANRMNISSDSVLGYFVNTVVLGASIDWSEQTWKFIQYVNDLVSDGIDNQDVSFPELVAELNPERSTKYAPLVQALFVFQNTFESQMTFDKESPKVKNISNGFVKNDLLFSLTPKQDSVNAFIEYRTNIFSKETANRFISNYLAVIENISKGFDGDIKSLKLLTPTEEVQYSNRDKVSQHMSSVKNLVEQFEKSCSEFPTNLALKYDNISYNYQTLNTQSNRVANYLIMNGINPGDRVGLYIDRSDKVVISILGILKAGATYVPIDSSYPMDRIKHILSDSAAKAIIIDLESEQKLKSIENDIKKISITEAIEFADASLPTVDISPDDDAYIIYTSGSTGKPKGVRVSHNNVLRLIATTDVEYDFDENDKWTLFHSYAFDVSVWEIWGALSHGSELIVVPYLVTRSSDDFYNLVQSEKVTVLSQTPSAFQLFDEVDYLKQRTLSLRYVVFGGEKVEYSHLSDWFKRHNRIKLINMYGITETTVHSTFHLITKKEISNSSNSSNIGRPLADLKILLVDEFGNLVRDGGVGEMIVIGEGVTNGYLNRPELNKERFISIDGSRAFKSGDLAYRHLDDLYYVGRNDFQVKIRGFRIELGEILSKLLEIPEVKDAFVKVVNTGTLGKQIVAYLIPNGNKDVDTAKVKLNLLKKLPDYMVPNSFVEMAEFPLNVNGKVDSKKLPLPEKGGIQVEHIIKPRNAIENRVIKIWQEVLERDDFGVTDSFFDLGGHSLLAVKIMSMMQSEFDKQLPISLLFTKKTVEELSQTIMEDDQSNIDTVIVPLSSQQDYDRSTYIVHPGMGQVMVFSDLARNLHNTDLAAIQAPGIYGERQPFNNMDNLAEFYVEKIIEKNPSRQKFRIAGYCVGGSLATKIVELLEKRNKEVDSLQIIDIRPPHYQGELSESYIVSYFVEQLVHSFDSVDLEVKEDVDIISEDGLDKFSEKECVNYLLDIVKKLQIVDESYSYEQMFNWYSTWKGIILGMNNFKLNKINAPITFYRALSGDYSGDEWNLYSDNVKTIDIPGDHYSILKGNNVKILANYFDESPS